MRAPQQEQSVLLAAQLADFSDSFSEMHQGSADINAALANYKQQLERICSYIDLDQYAYLLDVIMLMIEGVEHLIALDRRPVPDEFTFLQNFLSTLSDILDSPDNEQAGNQLISLLKDPDWVRPITSDEEKDLLELIQHDTTIMDGEHEKAVDLDQLLNGFADVSPTPVPDTSNQNNEHEFSDFSEEVIGGSSNLTDTSINAEQQELLDLINAELKDIIDNELNLEQNLADDSLDCRRNTLQTMADQAENISNAIGLIGLEGLCECGKFIQRNLIHFSSCTDKLEQHQVNILKQWPVSFSKYLSNIKDINAKDCLLELLKESTWIITLESSEYEKLKYLLENPVLLEEEQEERQVKAKASDVDLTLPDDVNQELLDGLLQDLPAQTEEFTHSINNLLDGGSLDNIDTAQRIAHTLKGAANVVGVNGIANLTHHLEDILQAQVKTGTMPEEPLLDVLLRAADCLESMAETLLGIDSQPEDALLVLQDVLDWANKLDGSRVNGITEESDRQDREHVVTEKSDSLDELPEKPAADQDKSTQKTFTTENHLRIPVSLADEMLRLAGENLIYTSQIQEHIYVLSSKQETLELHNQSLIQLSYDLEHLIDIQGFMPGTSSNNTSASFDPLELDEYHEIHTISRRLVEIAADSFQLSNELEKDMASLKELVLNQNQLHKEGEELVLRTRMVPIQTIIPRLKRGTRQASRLTNKRVELVVNDNNTLMDSEVLNSLIEPIMHILRNAIDHGIEAEEDRLRLGKDPVGMISMNFDRKGSHVLIDISDDGRGLDTDIIYKKALDAGCISADDDLTIENIQRLALEPGITTRSKVTHVSGRGIGLDVVSVKIRELKGSIEINSEHEKGTSFILSLPISSFSTHSLLVRSREYIYAISSHGVEEIIYPGTGEVREVGDGILYYIGQEAYDLVMLDTLLNLPVDRRNIDRNARPILLVKDESGSKTAIMVQEVIDSRDVVVKNMGEYIPKIRGIIGATVLGDGSVSPVIDLPELLYDKTGYTQDSHINTVNYGEKHQARELPYVLVVDDSLSARRSLSQFVQDLGFSVRVARDGMEAVSIIEASKPDLLLVDMEMPKMNGLELTSHIRATPGHKYIPIIMITSRSTDKHRKAAMEKGVDHYMVKPFDEDELSEQINGLLEIV
jgi:chemosensory pili system protein ChpA (sensor histidine kinase/response regulator)